MSTTEQKRAWRAKHPKERSGRSSPEKQRAQKRRWIGIVGLPEVEAGPGTPCEICTLPILKQPHADHDHQTGQFRGWLCGPCNLRLGWLENEAWATAARAYLERSHG